MQCLPRALSHASASSTFKLDLLVLYRKQTLFLQSGSHPDLPHRYGDPILHWLFAVLKISSRLLHFQDILCVWQLSWFNRGCCNISKNVFCNVLQKGWSFCVKWKSYAELASDPFSHWQECLPTTHLLNAAHWVQLTRCFVHRALKGKRHVVS